MKILYFNENLSALNERNVCGFTSKSKQFTKWTILNLNQQANTVCISFINLLVAFEFWWKVNSNFPHSVCVNVYKIVNELNALNCGYTCRQRNCRGDNLYNFAFCLFWTLTVERNENNKKKMQIFCYFLSYFILFFFFILFI